MLPNAEPPDGRETLVLRQMGGLKRASLSLLRPYFKGEKGDQGEQGPEGDPGPQGSPGGKGDAGAPGEPGRSGETGPRGLKGDPGAKGDTGAKGDQGAASVVPGPKGDPGATGPQGEKAPARRWQVFKSAATTDATGKAKVSFSPAFSAIPIVTPVLAFADFGALGAAITVGIVSDVTMTGCNVLIIRTRTGALGLLGAVELAPKGATLDILAFEA